MMVEVVKSIISRLEEGPLTVDELAKVLGINLGTCEEYLSTLRLVGVVEEIRSEKGRVYRLREKRKKWLFPRGRKIPNNYVKIGNEKPVKDEVVDLT